MPITIIAQFLVFKNVYILFSFQSSLFFISQVICNISIIQVLFFVYTQNKLVLTVIELYRLVILN